MKILFQGDSITDAGRDRADYHNLAGYTTYVADSLGDEHEYINLGISGNTSTMLLDRYESDIKKINPDIMTLLIGINDIWRRHDENTYISPEQYNKNVTEIITRLKNDCPNVKIIILEPFLLPAKERLFWAGELGEIIRECRQVALKYADGYVALDGIFAKKMMETGWEILSADGVHPLDEGNKLIAKHLIDEIKKFI